MGLPQPGDGNAMGTYTETYGYDAVGNLLTMAHRVGSGSWTRRYSYAEPSQIVAAETGNRLTATSLPGDPAAGPFSATYSHDAHGNMTRDAAPGRADLGRGRPAPRPPPARPHAAAARRRPPTTPTTPAASGCARRPTSRPRRPDGQPQDGADLPRRHRDLPRVRGRRHDDHAGTRNAARRRRRPTIALVETRTTGTDKAPAQLVRYQHGNHLGSAVLELDDQSDIISYEEYFPFGATSYQAVASQTDLPKRYRYTGKERDEENDLYYHGARYYAPWLGRWTCCDPAGLADGSPVATRPWRLTRSPS